MRLPTFEVQIPDFTAPVHRGAMEAVGGTTPTMNQQEDLMQRREFVATMLIGSVQALALGVEALQHGHALGDAFDEVGLGDGHGSSDRKSVNGSGCAMIAQPFP